jgi:hypothetical protein
MIIKKKGKKKRIHGVKIRREIKRGLRCLETEDNSMGLCKR